MTKTSGFDISLWQDSNSTPQMVDFLKAKAAGIRFAFIKAAQGNWLDQDFVLNWASSKKAGLLRGAYHFLDWRYPLIEQARFFSGVLRTDPGELPPVLDFESRVNVPDRATASQAAKSFVLIVEQELKRRPILYTSPGYWMEFGSVDPFWRNYPLWIAHYTTADAPIVPAPWKEYAFWQYTSHGDGPAYGVESLNVDLNWYNGTLAELQKQFGLDGQQPEQHDQPSARHPRMQVTAKTLNVRSGPGLSYADVGDLQQGDEIDVLQISGRDAWVEFERGSWCCAALGGEQYLIPVVDQEQQ
jgi:lysozyme